MTWTTPPASFRIEPDEVHVWRARLDAPGALAAGRALLSADERRRAERFRFPLHRARWTAARGILRRILAGYVGADPAALRFTYGERGKPRLEAGPGPEAPSFNLAHAGDLALLAVARGRAVGVDVEGIRRDAPIAALVRRWFAPAEAEALLAMGAAERRAAFFAAWTRKEAVVKARGAALPGALRGFAVPVDPAATVARVEGPAIGRWTLAALDPGPGFAAALAYEGRARTRRFRWPG